MQSVTVAGELRLPDVAGVRGLSVAYVLDGEYVVERERRVDASGALYQPLPVVDREVHAGTVSYGGARGGAPAHGGGGPG